MVTATKRQANSHTTNGHSSTEHGKGRIKPSAVDAAAARARRAPAEDSRTATAAVPLTSVSNGAPAASSSPAVDTTAADRGAGGRFTPGNTAARGNPVHRRMCEMRRKLLEVVTPDRLAELAEALFAKAKAGDAACAKLLLSYCLGKAPPPVDPDAQNLHEWGLISSWPTVAAVAASTLDSIRPGAAVDTVQATTRAVTVDQVLEKLQDVSGKMNLSFMDEVKAEKASRRRRSPRA